MLPRVGLGLLTIAALLGFAVSAPASAQTSISFGVNTTADAVDINIGDGICNTGAAPGDECSLRAAIQEGNAFAGQTFIGTNNSGGTMVLSLAGVGENAAATGDLDITGDIEIGGPGTVNANDIDRIFHVHSLGRLRLNSVNVTNGSVTGENGGGILVTGTGSFLEIDFSEVFGNTAAVSGTGGRGGGIRIELGATAEIDGASIRNNSASNPGGGISVNQAGLTLRNTSVNDNTVTGGSGGGITVQNDTTSAVLAQLKYATLNNVTIANNISTSGGAGMMNFGDINPTISNTAIAANSNGSPVDCGFSTNATFAFASLGNNLISNITGCSIVALPGGPDQVGVSAGLSVPVSIFGITHRIPVNSSSNLFDAGSPFSCEPRDAVGVLRPQGSGCDIGAIESKVGFAGSVIGTPVVPLNGIVTATVVDPDLRFFSTTNITATVRVNEVNIDVETITLDNQGDDIFVGSFQVLQSGTQTSSNGIVEMSGEGLIILTYADVPNGVSEAGLTNRIFHVQITGTQGDLVVNPSFELDANADKIPDGWNGVGLSGDKRRCNTITKTFAFDGVCAFEMKNPTGVLTQKITLPLPANIDDDMFLEVLVDTKVARPGVIASVKVKQSDGNNQSCKINLLAGTNVGAGGYQAFQCNIDLDDFSLVTSFKITLTTASMPTGKILFDRVSILTIVPRERSASVDRVLPLPAAPSGFRR